MSFFPQFYGRSPAVAAAEHFDVALYTDNQTYPRTIPVLANPQNGFILAKARNATTAPTMFLVADQGTQSYEYFATNTTTAPVAVGNMDFNTDSIDLNSNAAPASQFNGGNGTFNEMFWVLAKQAGVLDVVNYTGNGSNRTISHSLGSVPGAVLIRSLNTNVITAFGHRSFSYGSYLALGTTDGTTADATIFNSTAPTSSVFSVGTGSATNSNTNPFVAYLFGHDTGVDGKIQCGSYTGNGSATGPTVNLGWNPRGLIIKESSGIGSWNFLDTFRTPSFSGSDARIRTNTSAAEDSAEFVGHTGSGFQVLTTNSDFNTNAATYIYVAIR